MLSFGSKDRPLVGFLVMGFFLLVVQSCFTLPSTTTTESLPTPRLQYEIVNEFPHDPEAFTQGLVWQDGFLYEGTGLYGSSSLRKVELETGDILQQHLLPEDYFGEGITILGEKIYQLTWKEQTGFIYNKETFQLTGVFSYPHEGWGMTHDGTYLIISDGTSILHFMDPLTLEEVKQVTVHDQQMPVHQLNELEYVQGRIYANIWQTDCIAIIEPESGKVIAWIDLSGLFNQLDLENHQKLDVLNGIAYDSEDNMLFVTGKLWPKIFQIKVIQS